MELNEPDYEKCKNALGIKDNNLYLSSDFVELQIQKSGLQGLDKYCTTGKQIILSIKMC